MAAVTTIRIVDGFAVLNDDSTATLIRDLQSEVKTLARVDRLQTRKLLRLLNGTD